MTGCPRASPHSHAPLRCGNDSHQGVRDGRAIQAYADRSARDMARSRFSRLAKIVIVPSAAARAPNWRELRPPTARELATMATTYHDNVPSQAPPAQEA